MKTNFWLISILFLAIFLRFFAFGVTPPSLNWDETSLGYNAYSILKTGHDEWGRFMPISFEAFGDYKLPGYIYSLAPFIAVFGLNEFAIRLPSMLAGTLAVYLLFLIVLQLTKDKKVAIIAAGLLAISPWHVFLSRIALEANLAFTFFLAGLYFFLLGLKKGNYLIPSAIFWGLTIFTYNSGRIFIPLMALSLFMFYKKELFKQKKMFFISLGIFSVFILIAFYFAVFEDSSSRYYWVSIVDQGAINYLNDARTQTELPPIFAKLIYNRYVYFITQFIHNYLSHFSLEFLFLKGGSNYQFSVPNTGLLYIIELPFLLWGIFTIFKEKTLRWFILSWLLIAPIPSSITREAPHVLRSIFMLGSLQILVALGVWQCLVLVNIQKTYLKKALWGVLPLLFLVSCGVYFYQYFVTYPKLYSQSWQYGMKQAVEVIEQNRDYLEGHDGKKIYVSKRYGEPHIFYLFFSQYPPENYFKNPTLVRYAQTNWRWVDRLDNIYFVNDWEAKESLKDVNNSLFIAADGNYPDNGKVIKSIYFLDGSKAFDVVEL